jgi:hypothetical protein
MSASLDTQTKLGMSLDDLAARGTNVGGGGGAAAGGGGGGGGGGSGGRRRMQSGIVGKRALRRSLPYRSYGRENGGFGLRSPSTR